MLAVYDTVKVRCYGETKTWLNRQDAEDFYLEGIMNSEGSEQARYAKIYTELKSGLKFCSDEYESEAV